MKKLLFFIFTALFCAGAFAQELPKIAVYVTGDVPNNEKEALGTRILTSLVNSGRYIAIERSNAFLAEIEKEHVKQRSGDIDDSQISALGKQFGVKFVCIAAITPAFGAFQVSARIVNVETAVVVFIGESASPLKTLEDLALVSDQVVKNMFSGQTTPTSKPKPASGSTFTDSRDGKVYRKVAIGGKTWMAENLNYVTSGSPCYGNNLQNCAKYGRLYNWHTAVKACPAGWHLSTDEEWTTLVNYVGGDSTAGTKLKSTNGWKSKNGVYAGTDDYGFSALPGGFGNSDDNFSNAGLYGGWWSATEGSAEYAWGRGMYYGHGRVNRYYNYETNLYSVRCVAD
jgi:uncharacterized protein (TIGR02145 family)